MEERERPFLGFVLADPLRRPRLAMGDGLRLREVLDEGLEIS